MELELLQSLLNEGLSSYKIAERLNTTQGNVMYHLKKNGLKTQLPKNNRSLSYDERTESVCRTCKLTKPISEFYKVKKETGYKPRYYCKDCDRVKVKEERKIKHSSLKEIAIQYKGGKCIVCGYSSCTSAMDFHHINGEDKESTIANLITKAISRSEDPMVLLKKELDKCVLLCCRCHREFHAGFITLPDGLIKEP